MLDRALTPILSYSLSRTTRNYLLGWCLLAALVVVNFVLGRQQGLAFDAPHVSLIVVAVLLALGALFAALFGVDRSRVAPMLFFLALWLATRPIAFAFTYLLASLNLPLLDSYLDAFDKALGFDWLSWFRLVNEHDGVKLVLAAAYTSMSLQMVFAMVYFSHRGEYHKNNELWWACTVGMIITTIFSGLLPAAGTFEYYGVADALRGVHLQDLHAVRDGSVSVFDMDAMKGIITLPSYHAVATLLLTYVYRDHRRMLCIVIPLNIVQLISIPSEGGHYLADIFAGALVAIAAAWMVQRLGLGKSVQQPARRVGA